MSIDTLTPYAKRIVEESLQLMAQGETHPVHKVVSDLYLEVGRNRWDGTVNDALIEIAAAYVTQRQAEAMPV